MQELYHSLGKPLKANDDAGRHPAKLDEALVECVMEDGEVVYEDRSIRHDGVWMEQGHPHVSVYGLRNISR